MLVTAFGRLNLAIAGKFLQEEFHFSNEVMGWILGAFAFGYALFQIPSGWAGDRYGPRRTLTVAILWWSTLTILMTMVPLAVGKGSVWRLAWTFVAVRFLTGAGEAASYPNANKIVANWMAAGQRGIGSSLLLGGVGAGGVIAPVVFVATMQRWGWRSSFLLSGILAIFFVIIWFLYSTNRPQAAGTSFRQRGGTQGPGLRAWSSDSFISFGRHSLAKDFRERFCLGIDCQLLLSWLYALYLLHLVLHLLDSRAWAYTHKRRTVGLHALHCHDADGAARRMALRQSRGSLGPPPRTAKHGVVWHDLLCLAAMGGESCGR